MENMHGMMLILFITTGSFRTLGQGGVLIYVIGKINANNTSKSLIISFVKWMCYMLCSWEHNVCGWWDSTGSACMLFSLLAVVTKGNTQRCRRSFDKKCFVCKKQVARQHVARDCPQSDESLACASQWHFSNGEQMNVEERITVSEYQLVSARNNNVI